jgi:hypothetical protein
MRHEYLGRCPDIIGFHAGAHNVYQMDEPDFPFPVTKVNEK